ncbi:hypothetical protein MMC27_005278 [Xylographa pallens]|nr:hypothetical protein [Xylographa pallens]
MDSLPSELLCKIIGYITEQKDRKSLCEVSKGFSTFATPFLYNSITLNTAESDLGFLDVKAFSEGLQSGPRSRLRHVRHLHIVSPFRKRLECRCIHWYDYFGEDSSEDAEVEESEDDTAGNRPKKPKKSNHWDLEHSLMSLLGQLEDNKMLSFSWDLGICIPSKLLGENGILTKTQRLIESLSLTTGGIDEHNIEGSYLPDLSQLKCLRSLSWKAIKTAEEFYALQVSLFLNSEHLSALELDLVDLPAVQTNWRAEALTIEYWQSRPEDNFIASVVLNLTPGKSFIMFPVLQVLRLSEVPFSFAATEMASALNLTNLSSSKLHGCPNSLELLDSVTKAHQHMRLTSFELVTDEYNEGSISNFLEAFTGLEELYLLLLGFGSQIREDYWPSIQHHKSSLKRLVYDKESDHPLHRFVLFNHTTQTGSTHGSVNDAVMGLPLVECIGISDSGSLLKSRLEITAPKLSWKVLHIRWRRAENLSWCGRSNDPSSESLASHTVAGGSFTSWRPMSQYVPGDLHNFAIWAFGPTGLPKLRILASGDFSHKGRYDDCNFLLCRRSQAQPDTDSESEPDYESEPDTDPEIITITSLRRPYRVMKKEDWSLWDGIEGGFAMLEACPTDPLFEAYN